MTNLKQCDMEINKLWFEDYLFAGWLVNPVDYSRSHDWGSFQDTDVNRILKLLKRNKIPLIFLDRNLWNACPDFFDHPLFAAAHAQEENTCFGLKREWMEVREQFLKAGIESMLIKTVDFFPYKSSNLDVLIKQDMRGLAESILKRMNYIQLHNVEEPYKTLFRKFVAGESVSVIHLHNKVAWINPFHDEDLLWKRYRPSIADTCIDIPSPEDSILILAAHWFYEDKELKLSDIINISTCLKTADLNWEYMIAVANNRGWIHGLNFALLVQAYAEKKIFCHTSIDDSKLLKMKENLPRWMRLYFESKVNRSSFALPVKLPRTFGKYLHFRKTLADKSINTVRKLYEIIKVAYASVFVVLFKNYNINIRYQPSMLITLSGIDGSGKTTYAEMLFAKMKFCELKTRYIWSRVGSSSFLKPFSKMARIIHRLKPKKASVSPYDRHADSAASTRELFRDSTFLRVSGLVLLLVEMCWFYFIKVRIPLLLKRVVICDRYVYDTLSDVATRYGLDIESGGGKFFAKVLTAMAPKPDIAYVLRIRFSEACERRNMNPGEMELVKQQINLYNALTLKYRLRQINSSTNMPIVDTCNEMLTEVLLNYYEKWRV